jgi:hypothetical protein
MKCSCCNSILTPTYTTKKNGVVYRYYKSNKAIKHTINNRTNSKCQLPSIPAEQIENIVLNQIYGIIKTPNIIQGIIDSMKEKVDINLTEKDIINYLKNIEIIWSELFPREQIEIVQMLLKEIIISVTNIKIVFNNLGFIQLIGEAGGVYSSPNSVCSSSNLVYPISNSSEFNSSNNNSSNSSENNSSNCTEINIPIDLRHKAGSSSITTPNGEAVIIKNTNSKRAISNNNNSSNNNSNHVNNVILKALIRAEEWKEELNNNPNININTIAKREDAQNSYICRVLDLAFLAPDIKKSILTNNAPLGLSLGNLISIDTTNWEEQRRSLRSQLKVEG